MNIKYVIAVAAILVTAGCKDRVQKLCEANVTDTLLNPETAEMMDFRPLTEKELAEGGEAYLKDAIAPEKTKEEKAVPGSTYYRFRLRAEGQMGNTVTKLPFCVANPDKTKCECVALDPR